MSPAGLRPPARAALLALAVAACGPYADVAQKLDVTARVAGDTWIATVGADRSEIRVLLVGTPQADGSSPFAFSALQIPISRGSTVVTLQGTWTEVGSSGATTLHVTHTYTLPDESSVPILSRRGTWRDDTRYDVPLTVTRNLGRLVVAGDPRLDATYVPLVEALGRLGTATATDAACAFQVANLAIRTSEARIIGFGGPGMTQYQQPESYIGTVAGSVQISMSGFTTNVTTIVYGAFEDLGGVRVDGPQVTSANSSGDGTMSGVMRFTLSPIRPDGSPGVPIGGSIDYGGAGIPADAIQITAGNAVGGVYVVTLDGGGGSARVPPATPPSPSVSTCLALP